MNKTPSHQSLADVRQYLEQLQSQLIAMLEHEDDQGRFRTDTWSYEAGDGQGRSCVLEGGALFEKAGVNFSHIKGSMLPQAATEKPYLMDAAFEAMGVSVVTHPANPMVPISHANVRLFVARKDDEIIDWWFGGGFDLTPCFVFEEDAELWHEKARDACLPFGDGIYPEFKAQCDDYFYLPHRQQTRGIGGLFYDDLNRWGFARCFDFMQAVGQVFHDAYQAIVKQRKNETYTDVQLEFLHYRRGRYAEFNLLYDRGTRFGLQSHGRTESILMSMPPQVTWPYALPPALQRYDLALAPYLKARQWVF